MNEAKLKKVLDLIPPNQHESAKARIAESESYGWHDIHVCRLPGQTEQSDEKDLMGEKPNGDTEFLP